MTLFLKILSHDKVANLCYHSLMGKRLPDFDYTRPYFYMVTLKRAPGWADFITLTGDASTHFTQKTPLTLRLSHVIRSFHEHWRCIAPIQNFTIMPDHIHLIIKICPVERPLSLATLVWQLMRALEAAYLNGDSPQGDQHLFLPDWHDWIISKQDQLKTFIRYIYENPMRAWRRRTHPKQFHHVQTVNFLDCQWLAYGDTSLLHAPVMIPFKCSRKWQENSREWLEAVETASRIGPGCVGISTFMSPCEKVCGNTIFKTGGSLIILHPEGFPERWHPTRNKEPLCAAGRLLFLSLYPATTQKPSKQDLYTRCHEMGDLVIKHLK